MNVPRKSILGTGTIRLLPIRLQDKSPLGPDSTSRQTPRWGSCKKLVPIRLDDHTQSNLNALLSSKKKSKPLPPASLRKSRKNLFCNKEAGHQANQTTKILTRLKPGERSHQSITAKTKAETSQIPKPSITKKQNSIVKVSGAAVSKQKTSIPCSRIAPPTFKDSHRTNVGSQSTSSAMTQVEDQHELLQEMKCIAEEQKKMLEEAKGLFSQFLEDQRSILQQMKDSLEEQKQLLNVVKGSSIPQCTSTETQKELEMKSTSGFEEKENSINPSTRMSVAAYKEMRKSFRCLVTPTLSAKKLRTSKNWRKSLSSTVQSQLENLLDD